MKLIEFQEKAVKNIYTSILDSLSSLIKMLNEDNPDKIRIKLKNMDVSDNDYSSAAMLSNSISESLRVIKTLEIPIELRNANIEDFVTEYCNILPDIKN